MVVTTIATFFGDWALDLVKGKAGATLDHRLNPSAVERALKQAVDTAEKTEPELFAPYEKDGLRGIDRFLNNAFKETAVTELQKPLQGQGKPDSALLAKVFLREAEARSAFKGIDSELVEAWMQAFTEAYFKTTNNFLSFQVAKEKYYKQLRAKIGKVVFSGMAVDGTVVDEPGELAKIFVMPDVQRQSSKRYELAEMPLPDIASDGQKLVQWEQRQQLKLIGGQSASQPSILAAELLQSKTERRVVLLGAPGSGKTTLINYLVVTATADTLGKGIEETAANGSAFGIDQYFPILIRIRDLAGKPDLSVLGFLAKFAETEMQVDSVPIGFFQHWLETGQAIVLLDGLDEVADSTQRGKVVGKIGTFLSAYEHCPAIITSRPAGYRDDYFSRNQYPHYELLPFDDDKIEAFINHWYDSRVDLEAERERRKSSLRKALASKPRIKKLARNPLLLTIIALIHRYKENLPRQRHELYNSAVKTLISNWDAEKELTTDSKLDYLDIRDIPRLMKQLAYWIHTQGSDDEGENGTQIERNTLIRQLGRFIRAIKASENLQLYQVEEEAKVFLDKIIRDRAGLLSQQGENRYAFVHKTFQEYLCSQEILYLQKDQDPDDDNYVPHVKNHIQKYLHDPYWREVLLLLVAQQTPSPAKASLKTILNANSKHEQWLHRDLLFAGSCLAENAEIADRKLIDQLLDELIGLETSPHLSASREVHKEVFQVISSLQESPFASLAMQRLEAHSQEIKRWRLISYRSKLAPEQAEQELMLLLKDEDSDVRHIAACILVELGNRSDAVLHALLGLLKDEHSVRRSAFDALGELGNRSDAVLHALLGLLKDEDSYMRSSAAYVLGELGNRSDAVLHALLGLLKDEDSDVRSSAAYVLGELGNRSDTVLHALLGLLKDEDSGMRSSAAYALVELGKQSGRVESTFAEWIERHQNEEFVGGGIDVLWRLVS